MKKIVGNPDSHPANGDNNVFNIRDKYHINKIIL